MKKDIGGLNLLKHISVFLLLFVVTLSSPEPLFAQTKKINAIKIKGNKRVSDSTVLSYIKTRTGDDFDPHQLNNDLANIYKSKLFVDVKIDRETSDNGVIITFILLEKPVVKKITITGNKKINSDELLNKLTIEKNQLLTSEDITANIELLKDAYSEKGYYIVEIDHAINDLGESAVEVAFEIDENDKVIVKKINFIGNDTFSSDELKAVMETTEGGFFSKMDDTGMFNEDAFEIDVERMKNFYKEQGYIKVEVKPEKISLSPDKKELFLTLIINEGRFYRAGKIEIKGEDLLFPIEELYSLLTLKEGDVYNEKRLYTDILNIKDKYTNIGYAYANVYPKPTEDTENQRIDLVIQINKNELVYINEIRVTGNKSTRDKVVRRELKIHEGDLYSKKDIIKSREKLFYLGFFEEANVLTDKIGSNKMNLEINIKEKSTGSINVGGGYSSYDKAMGFASVSKGNFRGLGETIKLETQLSSKRQTYNVSFYEPWLFDIPLSFLINMYNTKKEYVDYTKESAGGMIRFGYPLFEEVNGYIRYKNEQAEVTDLEPGVSTYIADQEGFTRTSSSGLTLQRDTRDNRLDPTKGSVLTLDAEYAGGPLGGDNYYTKYRSNNTKYITPWWDHVIILHGRVSYAHGNEGRKLPIYERYYLGGINSLRGFDYASIGPKDPVTQDVIGGDKEILINLEYTFYIKKEANFKAVLFYDTGNAFDDNEKIDLGKLRQSVGYGVRWISPIGPLRLEWGMNLDPKPGEPKSQWEFTIGTFF